MTAASVRARLVGVLEPVVTSAGYDLEDLSVTPAGRRRLVRVVVDRDGGVSLDDVADLSRLASDVLDASDVMGEAPYVLEVSSPGVDRPLTAPRHWRRAAGRLVRVSLREGGQLTGRVVEAADDAVTLDVGQDAGAEQVVLAYADIARGSIQLEFARAETGEHTGYGSDTGIDTSSDAGSDTSSDTSSDTGIDEEAPA